MIKIINPMINKIQTAPTGDIVENVVLRHDSVFVDSPIFTSTEARGGKKHSTRGMSFENPKMEI